MSEDAAPQSWTCSWIAPALVAAVTTAVYVPSLSGAFVHDDHASVVSNQFVQAPASWTSFLTDPGAADPYGYVRPLRTMEFALDRALFGPGAFAFHVHSLAWHVVAAVVLLFVLRRLLGNAPAALVATLLWAVHPVHVEAVAWISSRGDMAMGACSLVAVLCALRSKGLDRDLAVSLVAAAIAPLYKETALALPLVVAALRWTKLSRVPVWPYLVVAGLYGLYRMSLPHHVRDAVVIGGDAVGTFATMSRAFGFYIVETLLPSQSLDWYMAPSTSFADAAVVAWALVHVALIASAVALRSRAPLWALAVVWFYAFLLPVLNWPFSVGKPTSERYLYLSVVGLAVGVGAGLVRARRATWLAVVVATVSLAVATVQRTRMWRDDDSLMTAVLADHESPGARYHFALKARDASGDARTAAALAPEGPAHAAAIEKARALLEESLSHAHRAIDLWRAFDRTSPPRSPVLRLFELLASNDCYQLLRHEEALFHAEEAARIDDTVDGTAASARALPLLALGFEPQAVHAMRHAARLRPLLHPDGIGAFFLRAASACEAKELYATALLACEAAVEVSRGGLGPTRRNAETWLADARRRPRTSDDETLERAKIARMEEALGRLVRSCPERRGAR